MDTGLFAMTLRPDEEPAWASAFSIRFVEADPDVSAEEIRIQQEQLEALGYLG